MYYLRAGFLFGFGRSGYYEVSFESAAEKLCNKGLLQKTLLKGRKVETKPYRIQRGFYSVRNCTYHLLTV